MANGEEIINEKIVLKDNVWLSVSGTPIEVPLPYIY